MEVLVPRAAGLDVHKDTVVACVRIAEGGRVTQEVRTFGTTTRELLALSDWLSSEGCTHAAMESTGVYWKPVWHILEGSLELILANATHIRHVPGRKTDVNDAMWIADLLAHGLIRGSFVPPAPVQEMRDLTRTRKQLTREVVQHTQRIQKTLEDANIKITGVVSDIVGMSGRAILQGLIAGESNPERLVDLTKGRLKASREKLVEALRGRATSHHRFLLKLHLGQIDTLQEAVREVEGRMEVVLEPFRRQLDLLITIPGVSETTARVLLAEIGWDMSRFPSSRHLLSWAGLSPRNDQSAGKHRSTRIRPGNRWLKATLIQAAWAAVRVRDSYLRAQFLRLKARRGPMKAIIAVAASMLTSTYFILVRDQPYHELTGKHFDRRDSFRITQRLVKRLQTLGYQVQLKAA